MNEEAYKQLKLLVCRARASLTVEEVVKLRKELHRIAAADGNLARGMGRCPGCGCAMDVVMMPDCNYGCDYFCEVCLQG